MACIVAMHCCQCNVGNAMLAMQSWQCMFGNACLWESFKQAASDKIRMAGRADRGDYKVRPWVCRSWHRTMMLATAMSAISISKSAFAGAKAAKRPRSKSSRYRGLSTAMRSSVLVCSSKLLPQLHQRF